MKSSGRRALQPRNIFQGERQFQLKKPKAPHDELQENHHRVLPVPVPVAVAVVESAMDASLAEELSAFKKKLERLREDRERTEKLLEERDGGMELQMKLLLERGAMQKILEIQVDRLFRLKELHAFSSIPPIQSLRAKEQDKRKRFRDFQEPVAAADAQDQEPEAETSLDT